MKSVICIFCILNLVGLNISQQYLSRNGTSSQSSSYVFDGMVLESKLAVEGGETNDFFSMSCSITNAWRYSAWWMLSFPIDTVFIENVVIFYRQETISRFSHYALYISNSTVPSGGKPTGHLCYQHPGDAIPSLRESVKCDGMGKNVIIYNHRNRSQSYPQLIENYAWLELCDVQVYGCYKGLYGPNCSMQCPIYCVDKHCFPQNGSCVWGCIGENCFNNKCDGPFCVDGCNHGFMGQVCNESCIDGHFGYNCNETCSGCVLDECDRFNGICLNTTHCKPGWLGIKCNQPCNSGTFGPDCSRICQCFNQTCDHVTGQCQLERCELDHSGQQCVRELVNYAGIIGGVISAIAVISIIAFVVYLLRRRLRSSRNPPAVINRELQASVGNYDSLFVNDDRQKEHVYNEVDSTNVGADNTVDYINTSLAVSSDNT